MKTQRLVSLALMVALSVGLHYLESLIPSIVPITGFKLGLANIVSMFVLYYYGGLSYIFVTVVRVLLVALISTGFGVSFLMSLSGAIASMAISLILYYLVKPSVFSLSMCSALFHTLGQLLFYSIFSNTFYIFTYLAALGPLSLLTGLLTAIFVRIILLRLPESFKIGEKKRRSQ